MTTTTTKTPRTDAACDNAGEVEVQFARQLERELNEAKAEVERLRNGMQGSCYCCEPVGEMNQKLEAEVDRLRANLRSAIEIAEEIHDCHDCRPDLLPELKKLKSTLNSKAE